jgi:ABC-2 type transport system permease protein
MTTTDFQTVFWKEWKEIVLERSAGGSGSLRPLILVAALGIFVPFRMGPERFFSPYPLLIYAFFSAVVITAVIADAFAGERERHTLETLLASRLSDRAILLGKVAASLAYGWLIAILCVLAGCITVNALNWHGHVLLYHDAASWLILLLGPPLAGGAVSASGVLVSLHASTVRQAQQTMTVAILLLGLAMIFGANMLPLSWRAWFGEILVNWSLAELVLAAAGVMLFVDIGLLLAGMARFQRARLILD